MRKETVTCDRCGTDATVCCDLVVPNYPHHRFPIPFWPWKNNAFDLCESCASQLRAWLKLKP